MERLEWKRWTAHTEGECKTKRWIKDGWSCGTSFIHSPLPAWDQTRDFIQDYSYLHFLSLPLFFLSASTLLLFPGAKCYPSPDFGIKVLPSSSTFNLFSSLFFHYTSLFSLQCLRVSVSLYPCCSRLTVQIFPLSGSLIFDMGGGCKSYKSRDYEEGCLITILQGVSISIICLQDEPMESKTADETQCNHTLWVLFLYSLIIYEKPFFPS